MPSERPAQVFALGGPGKIHGSAQDKLSWPGL